MEEIGLGRVHVLGRDRVALGEPPRAEAEHAPAAVGQWEDEPPGEVVVAAPVDEARRDELLLRVAALARLGRELPRPGREAEAELLADRFVEPALLQVGANGGGSCPFPEISLVEDRRRFEHREVPIAALPPRRGLGRGLLVLELDAGAVAEPLDRLDEVEPLALLHERDQVAALPAAEAVEELLDRVHGEARRPLLVEGTPARVPAADPSQGRPRRDDLDHVGGRHDLVFVLDQRQLRANLSVMPAT